MDEIVSKVGSNCQVCDARGMPTKNVNHSERQDRFIRQTVKGGQYRNASEVVRAGLRLLEQQQAEDRLKLGRLRRVGGEAFEALDRGNHVTVATSELDAFLDSVGRMAGGGKRPSGRK
jgi:antitoxin ParD1/3/4